MHMQTQTLNGIVLWIKVYAYAKVIFSSSQSVRLLINDVYYLDITYNRQRDIQAQMDRQIYIH